MLEVSQMKKYRAFGHTTLTCSMVVTASSKEEAIKKANEEFEGLVNYAGMGSCDCLVGVLSSEDERCIFADGEVEFDECEEVVKWK